MEEEAKRRIEERTAADLQREAQQGYGNPIISVDHKGYKFVAVKSRLFWGKWKTFFDFLGDYIKTTLGGEWGNAEIRKPLSERHPILVWYQHVCLLQKASIVEPGKVYSTDMTGAASAYYRLAYSLYLIAHNTADIQTRLIARLKNKDNFQGAYYEVVVAAGFIRAGFELQFENEDDRSATHCEFTATAPSGKMFSVEAKSRPLMGQQGRGKLLKVERQLQGALQKEAVHTRVVFIDLNLPEPNEEHEYFRIISRARKIVRRAQTHSINGASAPPAYVFLTNISDQYQLEDTKFRQVTVADGFNIPDFGPDVPFVSIRAAVRAREKHAEMFRLMDSLREHSAIPNTFDGTLPSHAFNNSTSPLKIGHKYAVPLPDGRTAVGILTTATVGENEKLVYGAYQLENGQSIIATCPLSDEELLDYKRHPHTFFDVYLKQGRRAESPMELFDFFFDSYKDTPRERLLEFLKDSADFEELKNLPQRELAEICCERWVCQAVKQSGWTGTKAAVGTRRARGRTGASA